MTWIPQAPNAKSVWPLRQGRPAVSLRITAVVTWLPERLSHPDCTPSRIWWATASGSLGRIKTIDSSPVLEASTPAAVMTGPATDCTMRVMPEGVIRSATTRTLCESTTSA